VSSLSIRGHILLGRDLAPGTLVVRDGRIDEILRDPHEAALNMPRPLVDTAIVAPGFIDLQVNGGFGVEVGSDADALRQLAACLPRTGVTAYLPTAITAGPIFTPACLLRSLQRVGRRGRMPLACTWRVPFSHQRARERTVRI